MESDWKDRYLYMDDDTNCNYKRHRLNTQISLYVSKKEAEILIGYLELCEIPELQEILARLKKYVRREELYSNTIEQEHIDQFLKLRK